MPLALLLIEDDLEISELLSTFLSKEGFCVTCALDGLEGEHLALNKPFDVIILDIMLPEKDGLSVLRDIRSKIATPILMLTAKGDELDRIVGFEVGADDYLPKPFNPRELLARIRALLRRVDIDQNRQPREYAELVSDSLTLRIKTREALIDNQLTELTSTEFNILQTLMNSANEIITKAQLTERALGRKLTLYDRAIDMHMSNLRKKLNSEQIRTIRGSGYLFSGEVEKR
jgi:two-component system response regulator CpxR